MVKLDDDRVIARGQIEAHDVFVGSLDAKVVGRGDHLVVDEDARPVARAEHQRPLEGFGQMEYAVQERERFGPPLR